MAIITVPSLSSCKRGTNKKSTRFPLQNPIQRESVSRCFVTKRPPHKSVGTALERNTPAVQLSKANPENSLSHPIGFHLFFLSFLSWKKFSLRAITRTRTGIKYYSDKSLFHACCDVQNPGVFANNVCEILIFFPTKKKALINLTLVSPGRDRHGTNLNWSKLKQ